MRVNIYAEEMTNRVELVTKGKFTGIRFYLYLPTTVVDNTTPEPYNIKGPFLHGPDDDDSGAVTFWGKKQLRECLEKALELLDQEPKALELLNQADREVPYLDTRK